MSLYAFEYLIYGRKFKVERAAGSGRWSGIGRSAGHAPFPLDKLGDADTAEAMQAKLDAWAKRNGLRPCNMP